MENKNKWWWPSAASNNKERVSEKKLPQQFFNRTSPSNLVFVSGFDGEKDLGGIGPPVDYFLDYQRLRSRGWDFYLTNEVVQIIVNRMTTWTIGCGLKLESEPDEVVLATENIKIKPQEFSERVEARFSIYKESFNGMKCLSQIESTCYKNAKNGGDVLVVLRVVKGVVKTQLIDGMHVVSPMYGNDLNPNVLANGNRIVNGVEMDDSGEHIAYHVRNADLKYQRIMAKSKSTGMRLAYLVGGLEYRLDDSRCAPALAGVFNTLAKMDRYKEATLATAESTADTSLQIVHDAQSTGENPLKDRILQAKDALANDGTIPVDAYNKELANKVAIQTEASVFNLTQGSEIKPIEKSKGELYFKDFWSVFFDLVCAAMGIPPNVAASKYDTSFSSARAAIKDWEHTLIVERYNFALSFLQPIYELWLHLEIMQSKIDAVGYFQAFIDDNFMVLSSFRKARWIGDNVPHIDPLKEVTAERLKLGTTGAAIPLTTAERATAVTNGGKFSQNMKQYAKELEESKTLGIEDESLEPKEKEDKKED
jgi:capsid protein